MSHFPPSEFLHVQSRVFTYQTLSGFIGFIGTPVPLIFICHEHQAQV